ncbi:MAG: GNAT family N-acetyltransferase [Candidatus Promineifilaceae bacterium]
MEKGTAIPTLATPRVILRAFKENDAHSLHRILSEPGVLRYFPSSNPPPLERVEKLIESHQRHWEENGYGWWAAVDRGNDELIGWCGLGLLEETDEIEIKYLLKRSHWGRGIATEAAGFCIDYAFRDAQLEKIIGLTHPDNVASQRVLEKIGLNFRNRAEYFGMMCFRFTMTKDQFDSNEG